MSRRPRDNDELRELVADDATDWRDVANTLEADGRAEGDPTRVEEARTVRRLGPKWVAEAKAGDDERQAEASPVKSEPKAAPKRTAQRSKTAKGRSTSKIGRATRQAAVGEPVDATAGAIRSGGSAFWSIALGTVVLILIYNLIANGPRAARLIESIGNGAERVMYPKTAFPERYDARPMQGPPMPSSGARRPRQLVPVANPRSTNSRSTRT